MPEHTTDQVIPGVNPDDPTAIFWQGLAELALEYPPLADYDGPIRQSKCMTRQEFLSWLAPNLEAGPDMAASPCEDCTPEFAERMRAQDQCNGTPGVGPNRRDTAAIKAEQKAARRASRGRRVLYTDATPCREGGCDRTPTRKGYCTRHYNRAYYRARRSSTGEVRL